MACHINDNVYVHTFTPREYQVELLDTAKKRNTIVCSSTSNAKAFISVKLLQEFAQETRKENGRKALFILGAQNVQIMTSHITLLTDLVVCNLNDAIFEKSEWNKCLQENSVIVTTAMVCTDLLELGLLDLGNFNLLVIDDCLYGERQCYIEKLMASYNNIDDDKKPRILGLAAGLLGPELQPVRLESELQRLEKLLCSSIDTSSELVTLLRLCCKPKEKLVEYEEQDALSDLQNKLRCVIEAAKEFFLDHRYNPGEIFHEFEEELKNIPDPKEQPLQLLDEFLEVLRDLGPFAADKAALNILYYIEKLKVKTPYERHYLLLCVVSTTMVKIRAMCEHAFKDLSEKEKVTKFSTPKVLRFLEIVKQFRPPVERQQEENLQQATPKNNNNKNKTPKTTRRSYVQKSISDENLCGLVFVRNRITAKVIYSILNTVSQHDDDFWWVSPLYIVDKIADPTKEPKEAENEHKRQEDVLRKYRTHECNIMVTTFVLEQGCDLPKCNLVIRFDLPESFHSYVQSKARARSNDAHYVLLVSDKQVKDFVRQLAEYMEVERTLLKRCYSLEPDKNEEIEADSYSHLCESYQPLPEPGSPYVNLTNSIPLINRYCAKLPSDTFTRLTPIWNVTEQNGKYVCTIRLPINSPVKQTVTSPPVVNSLLARRVAAFMLCQLLHKAGELDDNLQPVAKENFRASEEDWNNFPLESADEELAKEDMEPRPGTTKRRQYYYKRVADALMHCHPKPEQLSYFYQIDMTLTCPLPEEQNTRGRKIYPPEDSPQGFGILTSKKIPKICPFPIFTRSGEVNVNLTLCSDEVVLDETKIKMINEFLNYTFTSVLRLQKYLMLFDPEGSESSYLIVPTNNRNGTVEIDWNFISLIYEKRDIRPTIVPEEFRASYKFDPEQYKDAVVMPWYRNQDQPQYFYVAEICTNLNPSSAFPGSEYATFEEYYLRKYGIQIKNQQQHLLDVDHTSARLNFLTPRYVNRKGVALPTSSEETKKAKRENLEQKQILVPELCAIHPFPSSLWRKAVCLPCILYRVNALLLADQIRKTVATELNLGTIDLPEGFKWPDLNFGWNLSDVLKKNKEQEEKKPVVVVEDTPIEGAVLTEIDDVESISNDDDLNRDAKDWVEIGTWSNEMALTEMSNDQTLVRYASPTSWLNSQSPYDEYSESAGSFSISDEDSDSGGLKIEFTGDNQAEAVEDDKDTQDFEFCGFTEAWSEEPKFQSQASAEFKNQFLKNCLINEALLMTSTILVKKDTCFEKNNEEQDNNEQSLHSEVDDDNLRNLFVELEDKRRGVKETSICDRNSKKTNGFSFDEQPDLSLHPGPSPSVILQALTMSNANDGINLERLETIGDSFLKYAITTYLYCKYENIHEGKLSHLRSKQVSNLNLYRLGKKKALGECMIATKFDPHDNWLPPCYCVPRELEEALISARVPANYWTPADMAATRQMTLDEICEMVREHGEKLEIPSIIPYNLVTQHSIPDKSIADCVEALIGSYLIDCGPRGALLFMAWLGIRVLPQLPDGSYGELEVPQSPLLYHIADPESELESLLDGYNKFEHSIGYFFRDKSYLLQALTHASYFPNTVTDCYQRLEFLGDAVLDYLITRHLYEDTRLHSPGELTDLRSALVNNTIFASLAVRHGFHRYFRHLSPGLQEVIERFIRLQEESGHALVEEYLIAEYECEEVEDVEVPKALGDVFESVAGAIFLDSGMSLDAVWNVYYEMMKREIEQFSDRVPKSPIRELLELEPETAKFGKPEKLADGRRVRVTVEVFGKGVFKGIGRNYRIAKCTAAKCALKYLKKRVLMKKN